MATRRFFKSMLASSALVALLGTQLVAFAAEGDPSDVEGLQAFPGDSQVTLTWDPATDDGSVDHYRVYSGLSSVQSAEDSYTFGYIEVSETTYVMENLNNGVTYYFSVTAIDDEGNESESYAGEVEATPEDSEVGDFTSPTVTDASALTSTVVQIEFSEGVVLPVNPETAFSIESEGGEALEVLDAYSTDEDSVVFAITAQQSNGVEYILTASSSIEDDAGNPIVSGTSDTAVFTGSNVTAQEEDIQNETNTEINTGDFELLEVNALALNELELEFSADIASANADSFTIELLDDASVDIEVLVVEIDEEDPKMVTLVTQEMDSGVEYLLSMDDSLLNVDGERLADDADSFEFMSFGKESDEEETEKDTIAPEDITNLLAKIMGETGVSLTWDGSLDSAGDLVRYLVYQSTDGINFDSSISIDGDTEDYEMNGLNPGGTYTFKVTAVDESGNESDGVLTTIRLPEAGPEMLALFGLSLFGAEVRRRKKQR